MIALVVDGNAYTEFTSITCSKSLDSVSGEFNFSAVSPGSPVKNKFPFSTGQTCKVVVDGVVQLTGYIEIMEVSYSTKSHTINIAGRDITADIIDSTLGEKIQFDVGQFQLTEGVEGPAAPHQQGLNLIDIIQITLDAAEIEGNIKVINQAGEIKPFTASDIVAGEIDSTVFEFIEVYARMRQVILTTDGLGNIVLVRSSGQELISGGLFNVVDGNKNNIKSATMRVNSAERFSEYIAFSQENATGLQAIFGGLSDQKGSAQDSSIRSGRKLHFYAEKTADTDTCELRAEWEANLRAVRAFNYSAKVAYHSAFIDREGNGVPWELNKLITVKDEFANVNEQLLINRITWAFTLSTGSTTTLGLVRKDAYQIELTNPTVKLDTGEDSLASFFSGR